MAESRGLFLVAKWILSGLVILLAVAPISNGKDTYGLSFQVEGVKNKSVSHVYTVYKETYSFSFQRNGVMNKASTDIYAVYKGSLPSMEVFSICAWVKFHFERQIMTVWSYCLELNLKGNPENSNEEMELICSQLNFEPTGYLNIVISNQLISVKIDNLMRKQLWNLVCGTFSGTSSNELLGNIYFNGKLVKEFKAEFPMKNGLKRNKFIGGGVLVLAQQQDQVGGGFEMQESLSGVVSGLNIWNKQLDQDQIENMAECKDFPSGNVLDWQASEWTVNGGVENETVTLDQFCEKPKPKRYVMFAQKRSLQSSQQLCRRMGGKISVPQNSTENASVADLASKYFDACDANSQSGKTVWIGIDKQQDGKWKDLSNQREITYSNWQQLSKSSENDNCAFLLTSKTFSNKSKTAKENGLWVSALSSTQTPRLACTICEFNSSLKQIFRLRGLCRESRHDRNFVLVNDDPLIDMDRPYFKGFSSSIIYWNQSDTSWHLHHLLYESEATLKDYTQDKYPTGRQIWTVYDHLCETPDGQLLNLTLTHCFKNEFTCNDGTCVPMTARCDLVWDCKDRSDEESCKKIIFPADYESTLAPKTISTLSGSRTSEPLPIFLNLDILSFDKVDNLNMMFSVMVRLNLTWRDRRLNYMNLKHDFYQNLVNLEEKQKIWLPTVGFFNAKTGPFAKEDHYTLTVRRDHDPTPYDDSQPTEDEHYKGHENSLMFLRRFYAEYQCTFNLRFFPFDKQTCFMVFKLMTANKNIVVLHPGYLFYRGPKSLVEFSVTDIRMIEGSPSETRSTVKIAITFERDYVYHLTQSFLQSFLMSFLAYFTFWINMNDFQDRFMGSMTALLVLVSQTVSINSTLPKTTYFKLIDMWLQFFLMTTAAIVISHILLDRWYRYEQKMVSRYDYVRPSSSFVTSQEAQTSFESQAQESPIEMELAPMAGETKLSVGDKGSLENGDLKSAVKIKLKRVQFVAKREMPVFQSETSFVERKKSDFKRRMKKATRNAESCNNMIRFCYPALVVIFISVFSIMAHFKIGDYHVPHEDVDSWNLFDNGGTAMI